MTSLTACHMVTLNAAPHRLVLAGQGRSVTLGACGAVRLLRWHQKVI
jgi:hypothetical protein